MGFLDKVGRFIDDVLLLPEDVRDRLEAAEEALDAGRPGLAEEGFLEVLASRSSLPRAWVGLSQARQAQGDLAGALEALAEARDLAPDEGAVALLAARLSLAMGDHAAAADHARDAVRHLADDPAAVAEACAIRARAEWGRGRPDRAARELRKAISLSRQDTSLRVELVEALADARREREARVAASGVDFAESTGEIAQRVGLALGRAGALDAARPWLGRAADAGFADAHAALARMALSRGDVPEAESRARQAIARGGGHAALVVLAEVALVAGRPDEAAEAFQAAASVRGGDPELLRAAVRAAPLDDAEGLARYADALERLSPGDHAVHAARAWVALSAGRGDEAREELERAGDEPRAALARARLLLLDGRPAEATRAVDELPGAAFVGAHAGLDAETAAAIRRDALRALWRGADGEVDLRAAIDAAARFGDERGLSTVTRGAAALRDELDRPLLLAVLGEFNAGKSTLINAFIGADVAPMGIVPTTASLNVLRGGAERMVRVVRDDGTTREGEYGSLRAMLAEAREAGIDHVEIVLPSETLERVWILDTPGTNALDPDHERLAREAARRADAVLWVFDARQAGKLTESKILEGIRGSGRYVVPVLNKRDQLDPDELSRVRAALEEGLSFLDLSPVPISARQALRARMDGAADDSGFDALIAQLEANVFSRSRELKRRACAARLLELLDGALATEAESRLAHERALERLDAAREALDAAATACERAADEAVQLLEAAQTRAFREAAEEVLAFVRPRESRFQSHGADPEDRAFLAEVLERRLGEALDSCEARLTGRARGVLSAAVADLPEVGLDALDARVRTALATPLSAFWGFQRGLLAGGALHRFFEDVLPKAELEVDRLAAALEAARADVRTELAPALGGSLSGLASRLSAETAERREARVREWRRLSARTFGPLRALREVLHELS